jgi:hypothetical protein
MGLEPLIQAGQIFPEPLQGSFCRFLFISLAASREMVLLAVRPAPVRQAEVE